MREAVVVDVSGMGRLCWTSSGETRASGVSLGTRRHTYGWLFRRLLSEKTLGVRVRKADALRYTVGCIC